MGVQVEKAGKHRSARQIENFAPNRQRAAGRYSRNFSILHQNIGHVFLVTLCKLRNQSAIF